MKDDRKRRALTLDQWVDEALLFERMDWEHRAELEAAKLDQVDDERGELISGRIRLERFDQLVRYAPGVFKRR